MTFALTIQTFNGAHASHQIDEGNVAADWLNDQIWMMQASGDAGFVSRHGISSGAEQAYATKGSILSGLGDGALALGWDTDGNVYASGPDALGGGSLTKFNGTTLKLIANAPYSAHFGGYNIVTLKVGGSQYILDLDAGGGIGALGNTQMTIGTTFVATYDWPNVNGAQICMGKAGTGFGYQFSANSSGTCAFQRLNLAAGTATTLASFVPTDIDATWTEINVSGMCLDQTDGHMLISLYVNSGSQRNRLVKFSTSTGAIVWNLLLAGNTDQGFGQNHMAQSRILHQRLAFFQRNPSQQIVVVDTSNGTIVSTQSTGLAGLTAHVQQAYDDTSGAILLYCDYDIVAGGPTPLNGSTGGFHGWAALYVAAAQPTPGTPGGPATSRKRAWTFTLDGHVFYVLDLGQEGTWVYDKTTQTWSNFYTQNYVQWDVCNGVMWGNRSIGGDLATTDIWECAVSTVNDNGLYDIPHLVTGGLQTRSRAAIGCAALSLQASLGDLYNVTGSSMQMRYSDDNGNTWTAYDPITMTQGDYVTELRWRSLGSFAAPGRVFEFYDAGGPRSIGGCDAFLDDFDSERQPDLTAPQ